MQCTIFQNTWKYSISYPFQDYTAYQVERTEELNVFLKWWRTRAYLNVQLFTRHTLLRDVSPQKNGNMWEFWKNRGGVYPNPTSVHFTVFNMGDPPKKGPKMQNKPYFFFKKNMSFPNRGEGGGGPPLGKNSHIFPFFFFWQRPLS